MRPWVSLALLLCACTGLEEEVERNCEERQSWYPDEDGDGLGEPTAIFIGCEAPEGWVAALQLDYATGDSGDTAATGETGQTSPTGDTGSSPGQTGETGLHTGDTGADTGGDTADTSDSG